MTLQELQRLESVVSEGVRLRNRLARMNAIADLFLELDNPLNGGVQKSIDLRMSANGAELRFIDLSNQSRNTTLEISVEDGKTLAKMFREFVNKHAEAVVSKIEKLKA